MPLRKWTASDSARRFAREVVDRLAGQIADNRAPWQKQWDHPSGADLPPFNPVIDKRFKGLNAIQLRCVAEEKGFNDPRWITSAAAQKMGAHVRSGEKGTTVEFHRYGSHQGCTHHTYTVFNAEQTDGLPPLEKHLPREPRDWEVCDRAERLLQNSGARFESNHEGWSGYTKERDSIVIPDQKHFRTPEAYYAAAIREMGHWTGHESRLNRDSLNSFHVDREYRAQEDLRVQMMCLRINSELRLPNESFAQSPYKQAWVSAIDYNPDNLRSAVRDADRMAKYVLQYDRQPDRSHPVDQIPREARGVDDLPERQSRTQREPYQAQDHSDADARETLRNMPKPWLTYPNGASGAMALPRRPLAHDRDDDTFSR